MTVQELIDVLMKKDPTLIVEISAAVGFDYVEESPTVDSIVIEDGKLRIYPGI